MIDINVNECYNSFYKKKAYNTIILIVEFYRYLCQSGQSFLIPPNIQSTGICHLVGDPMTFCVENIT